MNWPSYLIQVNIYLVLFYAFYVLILQNETFFKWNRIFLISSGAFSFLIPLIQSEWVQGIFVTEEIVQVTQLIAINPGLALNEVQLAPTVVNESLSLRQRVLIIYIAGVVIYMLRFIWQLLRVSKSFKASRQAQSFFRRIKVSEDILARDTIVKHEEIHARQLHSADVIFFELISIINWFNPVVYAYKKDIKYIHEFIADESASSYTGKSEYALLLVSNVFGIQKEQLANNFFNQSLLKKRIMMLHKTKSMRIALLKYGLSAPLFGLMIVFSSATISKEDIKGIKEIQLALPAKVIRTFSDNSEDRLLNPSFKDSGKAETADSFTNLVKEIKKAVNVTFNDSMPHEKVINSSTVNNLGISTDTSAIINIKDVEVQPEYPGGILKFLQWVGQNYKYTDEAKANSVSGNLIIQFIVEKDGTLSNVKTLRDLGYGTGEAAVNLIKRSEIWKPALKNGNPVRVQFVVPLRLNITPPSTDTTRLRIRGTASINNNGYPLIILDGKPFDQAIPANYNFGSADEIDYAKLLGIKPADIRDITVLKDKTAITLYGDRASNGVLIINTKGSTLKNLDLQNVPFEKFIRRKTETIELYRGKATLFARRKGNKTGRSEKYKPRPNSKN